MGSVPAKWLHQAGLTPIWLSYTSSADNVAKDLQTSPRLADKHLKAKSPCKVGERTEEARVSVQKEKSFRKYLLAVKAKIRLGEVSLF